MTLVEIVGNLYVENVVQRRQLEELTARNAQLEAQLQGVELAKGVVATAGVTDADTQEAVGA